MSWEQLAIEIGKLVVELCACIAISVKVVIYIEKRRNKQSR